MLTGAGCSTASGIPDYRDAEGAWKHTRPMSLAEFTGSTSARRRYWAGSLRGWPRVQKARPNRAHEALAELERLGRVVRVITQNVDGLHQKAGSRRVLDLHGRLDEVVRQREQVSGGGSSCRTTVNVPSRLPMLRTLASWR